MTQSVHSEPEADGIVLELARDDVARKKFLKMAGKGMGSAVAASGLAAFIAACGSSSKTTSTSTPAHTKSTASTPSTTTSSAAAPSDTGDLAIVNYALTLEYLESDFYKKVEAAKLFTGSTLATLKMFGADEDQHVAALSAVANKLGKAVAMPTFKFPLTSAAKVASLAGTVENTGAAAYLGQAPNIKNPEILAAALAIHSVEGRHAATLNLLNMLSPTPQGAFAAPLTMTQVLAIVKPFIVA